MGDFIAYQDSAKHVVPVSSATPLPVTVSGGGGGGGAVTVADGADVALGTTSDAAASSDTGTFTLIALIKRMLSKTTVKAASTAAVATDTALVVSPRPGDTHTVVSYQGTITATVVPLSAATSTQLIASNANRKGLRWQVVGSNPATVVPGASAAVVGQGFQYSGAVGTGLPGDGESFEGNACPTNAFQAISTLGTTIVVWEQT